MNLLSWLMGSFNNPNFVSLGGYSCSRIISNIYDIKGEIIQDNYSLSIYQLKAFF